MPADAGDVVSLIYGFESVLGSLVHCFTTQAAKSFRNASRNDSHATCMCSFRDNSIASHNAQKSHQQLQMAGQITDVYNCMRWTIR